MSKYVWELKEKDINYFINWGIAMKWQKYVFGSWKCDLSVCEKLLIVSAYPNGIEINLLWRALKIDIIIRKYSMPLCLISEIIHPRQLLHYWGWIISILNKKRHGIFVLLYANNMKQDVEDKG